MELNIYMMNKAINDFQKKINDIPSRRAQKKRQIRSKAEEKIGNYYTEGFADKIGELYSKKSDIPNWSFKFSDEDNIPVLAMIGGIIGLIIAVIDALSGNGGFIRKTFELIVGGIIGGLIGALIGGAIALIAFALGNAVYSHYSKKNSVYEREISRLEKIDDKNIENAAIEQEKREIAYLKQEQDKLIKRKNASLKKLREFYDTMGLDNKYRNIVPIGYMEEFIRLGISDHLEGVDGLYYLIRRELRDDQLNYTLNEISNKLNILIDSNHQLYSEINIMNNKCDAIVAQTAKTAQICANNSKQLSQIASNTEVTAYNSQRIAAEAEFTNYMLIWNSFYNR